MTAVLQGALADLEHALSLRVRASLLVPGVGALKSSVSRLSIESNRRIKCRLSDSDEMDVNYENYRYRLSVPAPLDLGIFVVDGA